MSRATIAQLKQAATDLTALTGKEYVYRPIGGGFWDFGEKNGENFVQMTNLKLKDLIPFIDAYRRGFAACLANTPAKPILPVPAKEGKTLENDDLRVFTMTVLVAVDQSEMEDDDGNPVEPITATKLREYLDEAGIIDWDAEENGNVGVTSMEMHPTTLRELPREEVVRLYGK